MFGAASITPTYAQKNLDFTVVDSEVYIQEEPEEDLDFGEFLNSLIPRISEPLQRSRWTFDPDALSIVLVYHHFAESRNFITTYSAGETLIDAAEFKASMRDYIHRTSERVASNTTGTYGSYVLANRLISIADVIGWHHFNDVINTDLDELPENLMPTSAIDELGLFLSMLSTLSDQDVFSMLSPEEIELFEAEFGGFLDTTNRMAGHMTIRWFPNGGYPEPEIWWRLPGHPIGGPLPVVTRDGYNFVGWFSTIDPHPQEMQFTPNTITPNYHPSAFARWVLASTPTPTPQPSPGPTPIPTPNPTPGPTPTPAPFNITVRFYTDADNLFTVQTIPINSPLHTLPTPPARDGYRFDGWFRVINIGGFGAEDFDAVFTEPPSGLDAETRPVGVTGEYIEPFNVSWIIDTNPFVLGSILSTDTRFVARWSPVIEEGIYSLEHGNDAFLSAFEARPDRPVTFRLLGSLSALEGTERWYIAPVAGSDGYYTIESLGVRSRPFYGLFPNVLTVMGTGGDRILSLESAANNAHIQHWSVTHRDGYRIFTNRQHPDLHLGVANRSPALVEDTAQSGWRLERYTRTSLWDGTYFDNTSGVISARGAHLSIGVSESVLSGALNNWEIFDAGHSWNGISGNVSVDIFRANSDSWNPAKPIPDNERFNIYVEMWDFNNTSSRAFLGMFATESFDPDDPYNDDFINSSWRYGRIFLSEGTLPGDLSHPLTAQIDREKVFIHEIGHALKLVHPHSTYPYWYPLSIMNQGYATRDTRIPIRPSGYDRHNLRMKWGE